MAEIERRDGEKRSGLEALVERVPVFADLTAEDRGRILARCTKVLLDPGGVLCVQGGESSSMFILLVGKLAVRIRGSSTLATIIPVTSIGEMGVFTGEPRSATVEAMEKSALLRLDAADLTAIIDEDPVIGVRIMRRVIRILAERVSTDNARIREFQNYLVERESGEG
jgi:CRP-like cAMP-binding protein